MTVNGNLIIWTVVIIFSLALSGSLAVADVEEEFESIRTEIWNEIHLAIAGHDSFAIEERRKRLNQLFSKIPPEFTLEFHDELGNGREFSQAFQQRLATPVRRELLAILKDPEGPVVPEGHPQITLLSPRELLPPSLNSNFNKTLDILQSEVNLSNDTRKHRYQCIIDKLRDFSSDDRLIEWDVICHREDPVANPLVIPSCKNSRHPSWNRRVTQTDLHDQIRTKEDVEQANNKLKFMTHVRSSLVLSPDLEPDPSILIFTIGKLHDDVNLATSTLNKIANLPMGGGAMFPYYVATKNWIRDQQRNQDSLYSCF